MAVLTAEQRAGIRAARDRWAAAQKAERMYAAQLKRVAATIDNFVRVRMRGLSPEDPQWSAALREVEIMLRGYASMLQPWAQAAANRMLADVNRRDFKAWMAHGAEIGRGLRAEIEAAPTGRVFFEALERQVNLITSLPLEAAQRVHEIATGNLYAGARYDQLREEIYATGHVTRSRAEMIARTETARVASNVTTARAKMAGATSFRWETARDKDVRPLHRRLQGKIFAFDDPPIIGDRGERGLPGEIYNCRCFSVPLL